MYFDYERFVNVLSSMVVGYRYDVVHSTNVNRDRSDELLGQIDEKCMYIKHSLFVVLNGSKNRSKNEQVNTFKNDNL